MGTFLLVDVYQGLSPAIEQGRVKYLRVMEQIRKTEDLDARAYDQSPVMSYGTYYAKRCWGTVPVEADGSAHFKVPALREVYFQVLDAEGRELQRMTSAVQLMPGEQSSCVGCHETRDAPPPSNGQVPLAARRPAQDLIKPDWGNDGIVDFVKLVQPVMDEYCVECHSGADPAGGYDFSSDKTRLFNMAYDNLLGRSQSYRQHDMLTGEMLASEQARAKPLVHFFWLLRTPSGVNQPLWTGAHASRLTEIIESDHCGRTIPLKDRQRIYLWIDANVPYYGTYANSRPASPGKRDLCTDPRTGATWSSWYAQDFSDVYHQRCANCHGGLPHPNRVSDMWDGRLAWINFTHPHLSSALTAHLPKEQGGRGISRSKDGQDIPMFADTRDPDYVAMLNAIQIGKRLAQETPRADMPGFRVAPRGDPPP
jgi:mono/diheme cytochrome c family protein